jgi:hypothetical protein
MSKKGAMIMSIIGKLLKTGIDVVILPVSVAADIVTLGGALTEKDTTYTGDHSRAIGKDIVDIYEEVEKL